MAKAKQASIAAAWWLGFSVTMFGISILCEYWAGYDAYNRLVSLNQTKIAFPTAAAFTMLGLADVLICNRLMNGKNGNGSRSSASKKCLDTHCWSG